MPTTIDTPALIDTMFSDEPNVWNLNSTLAAVISAGLGRLAATGNGHPMGVGVDSEEAWNAELLRHAATFGEYARNDNFDFEQPDGAAALDEALLFLAVHFRNLWD